jgi:hypothetical protein
MSEKIKRQGILRNEKRIVCKYTSQGIFVALQKQVIGLRDYGDSEMLA